MMVRLEITSGVRQHLMALSVGMRMLGTEVGVAEVRASERRGETGTYG